MAPLVSPPTLPSSDPTCCSGPQPNLKPLACQWRTWRLFEGCRVGGRHIPSPKVQEVDASGAGDALAAAFCVAYLDGATPVEAAEKAVVVASGAVTRAWARPS